MTTSLLNKNDSWDQINITTMSGLTGDELKQKYDSWAGSYKKDLLLAKYTGPIIGASKMAQLVADKNARILDCACGTGMVGQELQKLGYANVVGVDISEKSLEEAERQGCYRSLHAANVMTGALPFDNDTFDAIACVGTFIPGHVDQTVFPEFIRVVKPGGVIVITMREKYIAIGDNYKDGQLDRAIVQLADSGRWYYHYRQRIPDFIEGHAGIVFALEVR